MKNPFKPAPKQPVVPASWPKQFQPSAVQGKAPQSMGSFKRMLYKTKVTGKDLAVFTRQLAATLKAGLLLSEALETISEDMEHVYFGDILKQVNQSIRGGNAFSTALTQHPKVFPSTYVAIIKSGEATGRLDQTTNRLAEYLESSERLKEKVKSAVTYPAFVVGFAILVIGVIVFFLIPKFKQTFDSFHAKLPLLTRVVMGISDFAVNNFLIMFLVIVALVAVYLMVRNRPTARMWIDRAKLKIPLVGKRVIHKSIVSRFCRTLGFLQAGGVGLATSLEITSKAIDHSVLVSAVNAINNRVLSGGSMSEEIKNQKIFPKFVGKMVAVGEKTGQVNHMLTQTADYYDDELENSLHKMMSLLEPVLIVFIGVIVLIVVLALYLPIFYMATVIK